MKKYLLIFISMIIVLTMALTSVALIPKEYITAASKSSSELFDNIDVFPCLIGDNSFSKADYYADCILLGIAYGLDAEHPLKSALSASYYNGDYVVSIGYHDAVYEGNKPNISYARYWHGSLVFIKPLLTIMDVKGIYILNAVIIYSLMLLTAFVIIRKKHIALGIFFIISLLVTGSFIVPFCIEYTSTYILMLLMSLYIITHENKKMEEFLPLFFAVGILTNFFDFLTTETITVTVPLLLLLCIKKERGEFQNYKQCLNITLKSFSLWATGYILTWISKWSIASIVLQENVFKDALSSVNERTVGQISNSFLSQLWLAIYRNVTQLFPLNLADSYAGVFIIMAIVAITAFCVIFLFRRSIGDKWFAGALIPISLLPYIRYLFLSNHSCIHFFFTYRAQFPAIIAVLYLIWWSLDKKLIKRELLRK